MNFEELKRNATSLDKAILAIKNNNDPSFKWFPVKNKKGVLLEVGGRNKERLEIKAYIPRFDNKKYVVHNNGFVNHEYSIDLHGFMEFPRFRVNLPTKWDETIMLTFLENTDFKTYIPDIDSKTVVKSYETIHKLNKL